MRFYDDHAVDVTARVGRRAARKVHDLRPCACGLQLWTQPTSVDTIMVSPPDRKLLDEFWWSPLRKGRTVYFESPTANLFLRRGDYLHQNIAIVDEGFQIDHHDTNGGNNMRENLRSASKANNQQNRSTRRKGRASRFKGVKIDPRPLKARYIACITIDGNPVWLGRHRSEEAAAMAYDAAAREHFGAFARTNYPEV